MSRNSTIPDRIPPVDFDNRVKQAVSSHQATEEFRKRVKEIFQECTETVTFKDKIKGYAGEAFNDKLFRNGWAIIIFFSTLIASAFIGRLF